jgi:hypothetical protein
LLAPQPCEFPQRKCSFSSRSPSSRRRRQRLKHPHLRLRREGSVEFAFVGTTGNASTQTLGVGGESIYRPAPWLWKNKTDFVRSKAESELKAQALLLLSRAEREQRVLGYLRNGGLVPVDIVRNRNRK